MHFLGYNMLAKFQFHCSITCRDILYFVFWLPYCHTLWHHQCLICIIKKFWISLERDEIWQKGKHHSSSLLKAFQIHLFFNTSIFHFIGTLKPLHSSFQTAKLPNRIHRTNAYSVKKIYLFLESNDQYGRKKKFSTVVLLYNERIFIGILKNQPPNVRNVNSYRKVLQTCSKAVRPCR